MFRPSLGHLQALKKKQIQDYIDFYIQGVPGGKVNILGGHIISHSKQKTLYEHVSYSELFPRYSHLTV